MTYGLSCGHKALRPHRRVGYGSGADPVLSYPTRVQIVQSKNSYLTGSTEGLDIRRLLAVRGLLRLLRCITIQTELTGTRESTQ